MLDNAVAAGDDAVVRFLRSQMSTDRRRCAGKATGLYNSVAASLAVEKKVSDAGKRTFVEEAREKDMMLVKERRLLVAEEREVTEEKRKKCADDAAQEIIRRGMAKVLVDEKKVSVWQQTVFPAAHAARMNAFIKSLDSTASGQHQAIMRN